MAPVRIEIALVLWSLAFNIGVAVCARGGWVLRGGTAGSLIPMALAASVTAVLCALLTARRLGPDRARPAADRQ